MKQQGNCYRIIGGKKYINFCDLIYGDKENKAVIEEAKKLCKSVRKIKHPGGYYQLFIYK